MKLNVGRIMTGNEILAKRKKLLKIPDRWRKDHQIEYMFNKSDDIRNPPQLDATRKRCENRFEANQEDPAVCTEFRPVSTHTAVSTYSCSFFSSALFRSVAVAEASGTPSNIHFLPYPAIGPNNLNSAGFGQSSSRIFIYF